MSPQASAPSMARKEASSCALTAGSASAFMRSLSRSLVSGVLLCPIARAASRRRSLSLLPSNAAARASSSCVRMVSSFSAASAFSTSGRRASSGSLSRALTPCRRSLSSLLNSLSAAIALSSSPRIRLLLTTSSASAGTAMPRPVRGSTPLPSRTMKTRPPDTLTASSANAWMNAAVRSSAVATALARASRRASVSPTAMALASEAVSACTAPDQRPRQIST